MSEKDTNDTVNSNQMDGGLWDVQLNGLAATTAYIWITKDSPTSNWLEYVATATTNVAFPLPSSMTSEMKYVRVKDDDGTVDLASLTDFEAWLNQNASMFTVRQKLVIAYQAHP